MPQLKSERMELFAHARARGLSLTASAREAGYAPSTCHVRGAELGKNPSVLERVAELQAKLDERLVERVTADRTAILDAIGELVQEARQARDRSVAMKGLELLGRSVGLFSDRSPEQRDPLAGMSAEQLLAIVKLAERLDGGEVTLPPASPAPLRLVGPEVDDEAVAA